MRARSLESCSMCQDRPATVRRVFCWRSVAGCKALVRHLCRRCMFLAAPSVTLLRHSTPVPSDDEWDESN